MPICYHFNLTARYGDYLLTEPFTKLILKPQLKYMLRVKFSYLLL